MTLACGGVWSTTRTINTYEWRDGAVSPYLKPSLRFRTSAKASQSAALGISKRGVDFDALDGEPVHILFLLVAPPDAAGNHLKALAKVSRLLKDKFFRQALKDSKSPDEILKIIREEDEY